MAAIRSSAPLNELLDRVRVVENAEAQPLSLKDTRALEQQLRSFIMDDALPRMALDYVEPRISSLKKKIDKLPTTSGRLGEDKIKVLAQCIVGYLHEVFAPGLLAKWITPELNALRQEIAELKARPSQKYCGVFEHQQTYTLGDSVTHGGSQWHCNKVATGVEPGTDPEVWTLSVKKGRDAKVDIRSIERRLEAIERKLNL